MQPQSGPPKTAGDGVVGLLKGLEQPLLHLGGDADPLILDIEVEPLPPLTLRSRDPQGDAPLLGELERIAEQVDQDLAYAVLVTEDTALRQPHLLDRKLQPLGRGTGDEDQLHLPEQGGELKRALVDGKFPRLDLGEVEDVIDQVEQGAAGDIDTVEQLLLILVEVLPAEPCPAR